MADKLPVKLRKEPLIEGLFEFRFEAKAPFSEIAPGFLFSKLEGAKNVERLPATEIPKTIRESDPSFIYTPLVRVELDRYWVAVGDRVLSVSCKLPYPGWTTGFRDKIMEVLRSIDELNIINSVDRHSIKYANIIDGDSRKDQIAKLTLNMSLGGQDINSNNFHLKTDWRDGELIHLVTAVSSAEARLSNGSMRKGVLLDIDTIQNFESWDFHSWYRSVDDTIDNIRHANKKVFFDCLTESAIQKMGPING